MLYGPVQGTPYDLEFSLLGIPVRVHVLFWLGAMLFSWNPDEPGLLMGGVICIFLSVLVHELGHAWVTRYFGFRSTEIWLHISGGFATTTNHGPWKNILVLLAGPGAGLFAFSLILGLTYILPETILVHPLFGYMIWFSMVINLFWSLFNLLPIWPMDGGQIVRNLFYRFNRRQGEKYAMLLSLAMCVLIGGIMLQFRMTFTVMMLAYFGVMSYQEYQRLKAPGRWN